MAVEWLVFSDAPLPPLASWWTWTVEDCLCLLNLAILARPRSSQVPWAEALPTFRIRVRGIHSFSN